MRSRLTHSLYTLHILGLLLILAVPLLPSRITVLASSSVQDRPIALVRIDLENETSLDTIAGLGLMAYARLYTSQGGLILLVPASPSQQEALTRLGYSYNVLDPNVQDAEYYLLFGLPIDLQRAGTISHLLVVEGRQAIARLSQDQTAQLNSMGIMLLPLHPHPVVALQARIQQTPLQPDAITPYPRVQEMINQVTSSTLNTYVGNLSGELPISVEGSPYTILTRYTYADTPIKKATRYAHDYLQSLGLVTDYDYYTIGSYQARNVIAQQTGLTQPNRIVLLTAHLDSYSGDPYNHAPGADDNASGSSALMLTANILSQYNFGCTLRYAMFTGEEQGLYGSWHYAAEMAAQGQNIAAVLNLDMLAYNTPGSASTMELHTRYNNNHDLEIANLFKDVINAYNINLTPYIRQDGESFSDHYPFWNYGFPAILAIEDWNDHTPNYHTIQDKLNTLNMSYYTQFTRAAVATFAHMGCLLEGQLGGIVTDQISSLPISGAAVKVSQGNIEKNTTSTQVDGSYLLPLEPGDYSVMVSAASYLTSTTDSVQINPYHTTNLNVALCQAVQDINFTFSPARPHLDETVTFTGTARSGRSPISFSWDFGDGSNGSGQVVTHTYNEDGGFLVGLTADNACQTPASSPLLPVYVDAELLYLPFMGGG